MADTGRADIPASDATARQNDTGDDPHIESSQPACASCSHRLCSNCGDKQEDWTRSVEFASSTSNGGEIFATGRALFDTGTNLDNLLSLDFVKQCKIQFEPCTHVKGTKLPWWKRTWLRVFGKPFQAACYTAVQQPIYAVGVIENLRWRGISEPRSPSRLHFPSKFMCGRFLVVKNLAYDAIFSSKTMNDARLLDSCVSTVVVNQQPKPTQDPKAARRSNDAKKEQKRIQQNQEQAKRDEKGEKGPPRK